MTMTQKLEQALNRYWAMVYAEGMQAFNNGHYATSCPYPQDHGVRHNTWLKGWTDAQSIVLDNI